MRKITDQDSYPSPTINFFKLLIHSTYFLRIKKSSKSKGKPTRKLEQTFKELSTKMSITFLTFLMAMFRKNYGKGMIRIRKKKCIIGTRYRYCLRPIYFTFRSPAYLRGAWSGQVCQVRRDSGPAYPHKEPLTAPSVTIIYDNKVSRSHGQVFL